MPMGIGLGLDVVTRQGASGYTFVNAEASALAARFTTPPTDARKALIDNLVGSLKTAGVFAKLDALYVMAAADSQAARQNWIADQYNLTAVSSPTFTADRGYAGDGAASNLGTGFNPATAVSPKYAQNSASVGVWSRTNLALASAFDLGSTVSTSNPVRLNSRSTSADTLRGCVNNGAVANFGASGSSVGLIALSRTASNLITGYRNGASLGTDSATAFSPDSSPIQLLSSAGGFSTRQLSAAHIGAGLDATENLALYNALNTYLQAVGAA